jgi:hypothetical protein
MDMGPSNLICQHEFELSGKAHILFMKCLFLLGRIKTYIHYQELFFTNSKDHDFFVQANVILKFNISINSIKSVNIYRKIKT